MKIQTQDLTGEPLNYAVAVAEDRFDEYLEHQDGQLCYCNDVGGMTVWNPGADWAQGGLIIEREGIGIERDDLGTWFASYDLSADTAWGATGPTPLIAAMRCYVASKLGHEVDVPEELT